MQEPKLKSDFQKLMPWAEDAPYYHICWLGLCLIKKPQKYLPLARKLHANAADTLKDAIKYGKMPRVMAIAIDTHCSSKRPSQEEIKHNIASAIDMNDADASWYIDAINALDETLWGTPFTDRYDDSLYSIISSWVDTEVNMAMTFKLSDAVAENDLGAVTAIARELRNPKSYTTDYKSLRAIKNPVHGRERYSTPWKAINESKNKTKGLAKGDMCLLIASTGTGKTTLLNNIAYDQACKGHNVMVISFEENEAECRDRLLHVAGAAPKARLHGLTDEEARAAFMHGAAKPLDNVYVWTKKDHGKEHLFIGTDKVFDIVEDYEEHFGITIDIIVLDYIDKIMDVEIQQKLRISEWTAKGLEVQRLQDLAYQRGKIIYTASQVNRGGIGKSTQRKTKAASESLNLADVAGGIEKVMQSQLAMTVERDADDYTILRVLKCRYDSSLKGQNVYLKYQPHFRYVEVSGDSIEEAKDEQLEADITDFLNCIKAKATYQHRKIKAKPFDHEGSLFYKQADLRAIFDDNWDNILKIIQKSYPGAVLTNRRISGHPWGGGDRVRALEIPLGQRGEA